ncbi:MAG TPA: membrane dipeptidase [Tepidisphaeraceae bacterium]
MIFDAHLDLAMNVRRGRDVTRPAAEQPRVEGEIATVGLPDLTAGGVSHVGATIFCEPGTRAGGYHNADEAFDEAQRQLTIYHDLHARGLIRIVGRPPGASAGNAPACVILIEGADCVRSPADVRLFKQAGVGVIGLSWQATRYAGGTGMPGPLTQAGREIVPAIDAAGLVHDVSHLAEQSFWDLLDVAGGRVIASHSNCRAIVGEDAKERHLSDAMIRALLARDGVIGINFYDRFLLPAEQYKKRRAHLSDVVAHVRHVCDLAGDARHVGIGTDMDGGLGREQIPFEIATSGDLPKIGVALRDAGFDGEAVACILHKNFARALLPVGEPT